MSHPSNPSSLIPERKRVKNSRGVPVIYDEVKKPRCLALTDTAVSVARNIGQEYGARSISQSVEVSLRLLGRLHASLEICQLRTMLDDDNQQIVELKNSSEEASQ